jgi:hypothetical protein
LLLYAPANYVYTFTRIFKNSNIDSINEVSPHENWKLTGYHDSCWQDKVRDFLWEWGDKIESVAFLKFAEEVIITEQMFTFMRETEASRRWR